MNTRKQVLIMSGLLMLMLVTIGIYGAWYPNRQTDAEEHFDEARAERGSIIFARNCRLCHGDVGEGGSLGGRLPSAPALDRPDLQGFVDTDIATTSDITASASTVEVEDGSKFSPGAVILIDSERMEVEGVEENTLEIARGVEHTEAASHLAGATIMQLDTAGLADTINLLTNTIACGRVGTAMPAWAQDQGGPLSDEQITQLITVITQGRWDLVAEEVDFEDELSDITVALAGDGDTLEVSDATVFNEGEAIRIGDERLRVVSINLDNNTIVVERGIIGTVPLEHGQGESVYRFPEVSEPSINEASCGQRASAPAPAGTPELIEDFEGQTVEVVAQNILFDLDEIRVEADGQVRVRLDNRDEGVQHNIAFYNSENDLTAVSDGSIGLVFEGLGVDDTVFDIPDAGTYFFRCDIHPTTMTGDFIVE